MIFQNLFDKITALNILLIALCIIATISFLRKLFLWFSLPKESSIGIVASFFMFFTVHDVHNSTTEASKKFKKANNLLNGLFWFSLLAIAIVMVFNTEDSSKIIKTKIDQFR